MATSGVKQAQTTLTVETEGPDLYDITSRVSRWVSGQDVDQGLLTLFCRHTSASLTIQENADPDVRADLKAFFARLVAEDPQLYRHRLEGPDDMPAHIRSALTDSSLQVPVAAGRPALGNWQGIYLFEHRARGHRREVMLHLIGR